jgi:hypothetical protein
MAKKSAPASKNGGDKNLGASHIALVSNSTKVSYADTHRIAKALQKQVTRDFAPAWHRKAPIKVKAFRLSAKIPAVYWLLAIHDDIGEDANGSHGFDGKEPFGHVTASDDLDRVSKTCSHELLEMLCNPDNNELSDSIFPPADTNLPPGLRADTSVRYLFEVTDPCQASRDSYKINGITVSDFCLPNYYTGQPGPAFFNNDGSALDVRPGGYVTFRKVADGTWWQTDMFSNRLRTIPIPTPEDFHDVQPRGVKAVNARPRLFMVKNSVAVTNPKPTRIGLVLSSTRISFANIRRIAQALQKQVTRHFAQAWNIRARIDAFRRPEDAPGEYWLIEIRDNIGEAANGFHRFGKEPVGYVTASEDLNQVSRTCSHELLEILCNPHNNRLSGLQFPPADTNLPPELRGATPVKYLFEVTDPCQAGRDSYQIDGITVCDFCLPNYYEGKSGRAFQHSDGGALEVRPGGYVTFRKEADGSWWQTDMFSDRLRTRQLSTPPEGFEASNPTEEETGNSRSEHVTLSSGPRNSNEKSSPVLAPGE